MMYNNLHGGNAFSDLFVMYERYAKDAQNSGKKPVSLLKFAFGNF